MRFLSVYLFLIQTTFSLYETGREAREKVRENLKQVSARYEEWEGGVQIYRDGSTWLFCPRLKKIQINKLDFTKNLQNIYYISQGELKLLFLFKNLQKYLYFILLLLLYNVHWFLN